MSSNKRNETTTSTITRECPPEVHQQLHEDLISEPFVEWKTKARIRGYIVGESKLSAVNPWVDETETHHVLVLIDDVSDEILFTLQLEKDLEDWTLLSILAILPTHICILGSFFVSGEVAVMFDLSYNLFKLLYGGKSKLPAGAWTYFQDERNRALVRQRKAGGRKTFALKHGIFDSKFTEAVLRIWCSKGGKACRDMEVGFFDKKYDEVRWEWSSEGGKISTFSLFLSLNRIQH